MKITHPTLAIVAIGLVLISMAWSQQKVSTPQPPNRYQIISTEFEDYDRDTKQFKTVKATIKLDTATGQSWHLWLNDQHKFLWSRNFLGTALPNEGTVDKMQ